MVKATRRIQPGLTTKVGRAQTQQEGDDVAAAALPHGKTAPTHVRTPRESIMQKNARAKRGNTSATAEDLPRTAKATRSHALLHKLKAAKKTSAAPSASVATGAALAVAAKSTVVVATPSDAGNEADTLRRCFITQQQLGHAARRKAERQRRAGMGSPPQRRRTAAQERMAVAAEELSLYDSVVSVPAFAADPFAALQQHLSTTMESLKPLTDDVGRLPRA